MNKAILVIDMPESCDGCYFVDSSEQGKLWCGVPMFGHEVTHCTDCKHSDCPLKEVPEKVQEKEMEISHSESVEMGYSSGWNDCIDEILRSE